MKYAKKKLFYITILYSAYYLFYKICGFEATMIFLMTNLIYEISFPEE